MDNRLKFLYCLITELWGRGGRPRAGKGKPGASMRVRRRKNPSGKRTCDAERNKVAKSGEPAPRKAAIVYKVPVP